MRANNNRTTEEAAIRDVVENWARAVRTHHLEGILVNRSADAAKGHVEVVEINYDASQINYSQLLEVFWRQIDPTDAGGQFVDAVPLDYFLPRR